MQPLALQTEPFRSNLHHPLLVRRKFLLGFGHWFKCEESPRAWLSSRLVVKNWD